MHGFLRGAMGDQLYPDSPRAIKYVKIIKVLTVLQLIISIMNIVAHRSFLR